jgi:hypothetical protein
MRAAHCMRESLSTVAKPDHFVAADHPLRRTSLDEITP